MFKRTFNIFLCFFITVVAILLPYFRNKDPLITKIYNFISVANKDYYGVVLSALAIFVTFLIFNSQNEKDKKIRFDDEQRRQEREKKEYLENREKRLASARPYFIVEKDNTAAKAKIKIFIEDNVPLENILVCERKLSDEESEVKSQIIGTSNSGDYLYECSLNELESLERSYLSDYLVDKKENYELKDVNTEIYKQNIYSVAWERVAKKRFSQYRSQILESIIADRIFTENKNLEILGVIEKDNVGEILGSSITYLREHYKDFSNETIIELLETIKKYMTNYWYTTCTELSEERRYYFKGNLPNTPLLEKYSTLFDKSVDAKVMINYVDHLILLAKKDYFSDFLFRNLEVYLNEHVEIASERIGFDNEVNLVYNEIRSKIKKILSKTL